MQSVVRSSAICQVSALVVLDQTRQEASFGEANQINCGAYYVSSSSKERDFEFIKSFFFFRYRATSKRELACYRIQ